MAFYRITQGSGRRDKGSTWLVSLESRRSARALPPLNSISPVYVPPMLASAPAAKSTTWHGSMMSPLFSSRGSVDSTILHRASTLHH